MISTSRFVQLVPVALLLIACGGAATRAASEAEGGAEPTGAGGRSATPTPCAGVPKVADPVLDGLVHDLAGLERGAPLTLDALSRVQILSAYEPVASLAGLECLPNLQALLLNAGGTIANFSALSGLAHLESLAWFGDFPSLNDFSSLAPLTSLTFLNIGGTSVSDISALHGLTNLTTLALGNNQISDVSALASLTNLRSELLLSGNHISDVSPLTSLTSVVSLQLSANVIADIAPLAASFCTVKPDPKEGHCSLELGGNLLDCAAQAPYIARLRGRGVDVFTDCR